jgi:acyl CoA:acetate/3-ketoacid CoA transferase alpha subunit
MVEEGDSVDLEGFTYLIPSAAAHEIIRQERRNLTLIRMTPDLIYDQMIGMGWAEKLIFSWGGNPGVGSLHRFRDAVEHGWPCPLEMEEHSHTGMANRCVAGASNLPFAVLRGYIGTDLPEVTSTIAPITCPFAVEEVVVVFEPRPFQIVLPHVAIDAVAVVPRGAHLAIWQADEDGFYDVQYEGLSEARGRGQLRDDDEGRFHFRTVRPESYPIPGDGPVGEMLEAADRSLMRPAHIHFMVSAPGYEPVTTHVFEAGEEYLDSDAVFGVKESLITEFVRHEPGTAPDRTGLDVPYYPARYDFVLAPSGEADG